MRLFTGTVSNIWKCILFCVMLTPAFGQHVYVNDILIAAGTTENDDFSDMQFFVEPVKNARIVHLKGDGGREAMELFQRARKRIIHFLNKTAGYKVLVMPVGIFEGAWANQQLENQASAKDAAQTFYRVWRESDEFLNLLYDIQMTRQGTSPVEIIGGLCRYHAVGKSLYSPHLISFFDDFSPNLLNSQIKAEIERCLAGRDRLSKATPELRESAATLVENLMHIFDTAEAELAEHYGERRANLEKQFLKNMKTFVELEKLRAGDLPDDEGFHAREKLQNLEWFLKHRYSDEKIIYWEGRGAGDEPLSAPGATIFEMVLSAEEG